MPRVICAGHVNWDVTLHVDDLPEPDGEAQVRETRAAGGGSAANVAAGLAGLRVDASLLGSVGGDSYGTEARHELAAAGVDTTHIQVMPDRPTAVKYIAVDTDGEVMVFGIPGANEAFDGDALPDTTLAETAHLHLTGQSPPTADRLAERAAAADVTVSVDPGRLVGDRDFAPVIERADLLFLNDREAEVALEGDFEGTLVLKHGPEGAEVRVGDERYTHPGFGVAAVDTTGAGDAFAAGFLAARLGGAGYERSLTVANACGALASEVRGARAPLSWDAIDSLRRRSA